MYGFHSVEQEMGTRQRIYQALRSLKPYSTLRYFKHHYQQGEMFQRRVTFLSLIFLDKCFNQQLRLSDLLRTYWYYWSKHTKSSVSKFFKKKKKTQVTPYLQCSTWSLPRDFKQLLKKSKVRTKVYITVVISLIATSIYVNLPLAVQDH